MTSELVAMVVMETGSLDDRVIEGFCH